MLQLIVSPIRGTVLLLNAMLRIITNCGNPRTTIIPSNLSDIPESKQQEIKGKLEAYSLKLQKKFDSPGSEGRIKEILEYICEWILQQ